MIKTRIRAITAGAALATTVLVGGVTTGSPSARGDQDQPRLGHLSVERCRHQLELIGRLQRPP